jgi:hypothetical protein
VSSSFPSHIIHRWHSSLHNCSNSRQRSSTTNPTVHDHGRGYSNSFTLCRGCTLYPHHSATHRVGASPHNDVCHDKQPIINVSSAHLSINTTTKRCVPQHQCPIGCPGCAKSPAAYHSGMILILGRVLLKVVQYSMRALRRAPQPPKQEDGEPRLSQPRNPGHGVHGRTSTTFVVSTPRQTIYLWEPRITHPEYPICIQFTIP